jgi:hypothetical protein
MTARTPATDKGTADRIEADDGGYSVRLVTWQALDREGTCMHHCVGDGGYDDLVGGEDLHDDAIWSLRDRDGLSILTVRIRHRELNYAKGPFNHAPGRGASMQVRHLVAAFKAAGRCLDVSTCETEIVLLEDGRTFRHDRLPPEVQAEREAAQNQRGPQFVIGGRQFSLRPMGVSEILSRIDRIEGFSEYDPFQRLYRAAVAPLGEAQPAPATGPEDSRIGPTTNVVPAVTAGDFISLRDPTGSDVFNVSQVAIRDASGQPLVAGADYRVDTTTGVVVMHAAHDQVTIDFHAGPRPRVYRLDDLPSPIEWVMEWSQTTRDSVTLQE